MQQPYHDPHLETLRRALQWQQQGQLAEAEACYRQVLALAPGHANAWQLLGIVLGQSGRAVQAVDCLRRCCELKPEDPMAWHNLASALQVQGQAQQALQACERALTLNPVYVAGYGLRASILWQLGQQQAALEAIERALALHPADAQAQAQRAAMLAARAQAGGAAAANRAAPLSAADPEFLCAAGLQFLAQRQYTLAVQALERALAINPRQEEAIGPLLLAKQHAADWSGWPAQVQRLEQLVRTGRFAPVPFTLLACSDDPLLLRRSAERYFPARPVAAPVRAPLCVRSDGRIHVAYLSADFHEHATAYLMARLFELHDRRRFEVTALSFGPQAADAMRARLTRAFDRFESVQGQSDAAVAQRLEQLGVAIVVDLKGFTQDSRPGIFALRPAPVSVNYLGYPGTMGSPCLDYLIGDPVVTPMAHAAYFAEQIVQLPHCYQPNDDQRPIAPAPSRAEAGLPATGLVFAAFNALYKITPPVFDVWMRLLHAVPGSVLWLVGEYAPAQQHLRQQAQARGVEPTRLVFARYAPQAQHLARQQLADLFLDTFPCTAHTTASDALWAGLPLLTCQGQTFAARVAASLLHAVGLPQLVTQSLAEYEALALQLARQPQQLAALRQQLLAQRRRSPLFDAVGYTQALETAYQHMHQLAQQGLAPTAFSVPAGAGAVPSPSSL